MAKSTKPRNSRAMSPKEIEKYVDHYLQDNLKEYIDLHISDGVKQVKLAATGAALTGLFFLALALLAIIVQIWPE